MTLQDILDQYRKGQLKKADFEAAIYNIINNHTQNVLMQELENERRVFIRDNFAKIFTSNSFFPVNPSELKPEHMKEDNEWGEYVITGGKVFDYRPPKKKYSPPKEKYRLKWYERALGVEKPEPEEPQRYSFDDDKWGMQFAYDKAVKMWNHFQTKLDEERRAIQEAQKKMQEKAKEKQTMKVVKDEGEADK